MQRVYEWNAIVTENCTHDTHKDMMIIESEEGKIWNEEINI